MKMDNLSEFMPISLEEMKNVRLMNRIDVKYLTTIDKLRKLLKIIVNDYFVQETAGKRNMPYSTVYYDTNDIEMYNEHQRGRAVRQKIRVRTYETTNVQFLEVKQKDNKGRTKKKRIEVPRHPDIADYAEFIEKNSRYHTYDLSTKLRNHFQRITLVNKNMTERLTIDTNLCFHSDLNNKDYSLDNLAIIELKRDGLCPSPIIKKLKKLRIHSSGFSKYCIGMALTNSSLRCNRIKPKIRKVQRLNTNQNN